MVVWSCRDYERQNTNHDEYICFDFTHFPLITIIRCGQMFVFFLFHVNFVSMATFGFSKQHVSPASSSLPIASLSLRRANAAHLNITLPMNSIPFVWQIVSSTKTFSTDSSPSAANEAEEEVGENVSLSSAKPLIIFC